MPTRVSNWVCEWKKEGAILRKLKLDFNIETVLVVG